MGFKFRLERLLNYKGTIEDLKKTEYGEEVYKLSLEEEKLQKIIDKRKKIIDDKNSDNKTFNIAILRSYNSYMERLNEDIKRQENNVISSRNKVEKAKEKLLEAMQEKKAFEKLKEKDFEEYQEEEKRKEAKIVDEIITFKSNA